MHYLPRTRRALTHFPWRYELYRVARQEHNGIREARLRRRHKRTWLQKLSICPRIADCGWCFFDTWVSCSVWSGQDSVHTCNNWKWPLKRNNNKKKALSCIGDLWALSWRNYSWIKALISRSAPAFAWFGLSEQMYKLLLYLRAIRKLTFTDISHI